jgi:hypothetical protein
MSPRGSNNASDDMGPAGIAFEKHYKPQEVAELWGISASTVRRLFRGVPGVLEWGNDETRWSRKRKEMRIPASVVERVHELKFSK